MIHTPKSGIPNCSICDFMGQYSWYKLQSPNAADIEFMDSVSTKHYTNELGMWFRVLCDWKPVSTMDSMSLIWRLCSSVLQGFCVYHRLNIWHRFQAFIVNITAEVSLPQITPNNYISEICIVWLRGSIFIIDWHEWLWSKYLFVWFKGCLYHALHH